MHVYENHFSQMQEQALRVPFAFPRVRIDPSLKDIDDLDFHHIILEDYTSHPPIKADMAIVG